MTAISPADPRPPASELRSRAGKRFSLIVPMFNEEACLPAFFATARPLLDSLGMDWEIVCVDDGSRDGTVARVLAERLGEPRIKLARLARNFGKESALSAGLSLASGDVVAPIDADLQDPPELIAEFLAKWEQGYDVVYGVRQDRSSDTALKRLTARNFYRVFNAVADAPIPPDTGDFRLMDRKVVDAVNALPERNRFMKGLFAWVGFNQVGVPYTRLPREQGQSSWRYWKLWNFALDGITSFSSWPLRMWSYLGLGVAALAFVSAFVLILYTLFHGSNVRGYPSLMVTLLFFSGLQMLALGVLGEYVSRLYQEVKGRPVYIVSHTVGFD
jgi:glycosyltransferase involved in cell wall biosynthesis